MGCLLAQFVLVLPVGEEARPARKPVWSTSIGSLGVCESDDLSTVLNGVTRYPSICDSMQSNNMFALSHHDIRSARSSASSSCNCDGTGVDHLTTATLICTGLGVDSAPS